MAGQENVLDFELQILRVGDRYVANVHGRGSTEFGIDFSPDELDELFRGLGRVRKVARGGASPEVARARDFGGRLFRSVLSAGLAGRVLDELRARAQERNAQLRIRLSLDGVPELLDLPWELLFDADRNQFIALDERITLVRDLPVMEPEKPIRIDLPLKVLVAIANPRGTAPLDANGEWQKLERALEPLRRRGALQLERLEHATFDGLMEKLQTGEWHVLHFIGHGGYDTLAGEGKLLLENQTGQCALLGAGRLASLLRKHDTLRLVVLNACEGGRASRQDAFAGVAQALVQKAIPAVVAMQFPVTDAAAIEFSGAFYKALADGRPVDQAVSDARSRVSFAGDEGEIEWATPVLYLRGDGRLFDLVAETKPAAESPTVKPGSGEGKPDGETEPGGGSGDEKKRPWWVLPVLGAVTMVALAWGAYRIFWPRPDSPIVVTTPEAPVVPPAPPVAPASQATPAPQAATPAVAPVVPVAPAPPAVAPARQAVIAGPKPLYKPYKTGDVFQECDSCPEMVVIVPDRDFTIGSPQDEKGHEDDEKPFGPIRFAAPYAIGRFEVTRGQFERSGVAGAKGCYAWSGSQWEFNAAADWRDPKFPDGFRQGNDHPVVCVNWDEAQAYVKWLNAQRAGGAAGSYRLPSEAEWEYAARGNTTTARFWGAGPDAACKYANVADRTSKARINWATIHECDDGHVFTAPVGGGQAGGGYRFRPNPFGLYDMLGNAWEWMQDCYQAAYDVKISDGSAFSPSGSCDRRVLRGGSWSSGPGHVRSANRIWDVPGYRGSSIGFRVARTLP